MKWASVLIYGLNKRKYWRTTQHITLGRSVDIVVSPMSHHVFPLTGIGFLIRDGYRELNIYDALGKMIQRVVCSCSTNLEELPTTQVIREATFSLMSGSFLGKNIHMALDWMDWNKIALYRINCSVMLEVIDIFIMKMVYTNFKFY